MGTNEATPDGSAATAGSPTSPLHGIRVLDLSRAIAGPYPARIMADLGADVVKVEPPEGDVADVFGKKRSNRSGLFAQMNAGKRNIRLDLKDPDDRATAVRLAAVADVVIENYRVGVLARLGLGYETIAATNPGVILLSVSGFGQTSPEAGRRAYAPVLHAESGLLRRQARFDGDRPVTDIAFNAADTLTGLHGAVAVLAALQLRHRTGRGQHIDLSMLAAIVASDDYVHYALDDVPTERGTGTVFDLQGWSVLLAGEVKYLWSVLSRSAGLRDDGGGTIEDKRIRRTAIIHEWLKTVPDRDAVIAHLEAGGLAWAEVKAPEDVLHNETFVADPPYAEVPDPDGAPRRIVRMPYRFSDATCEVRGNAAQLDEHAVAVRHDWLDGSTASATAAVHG
jgi:CoA:oxalate CoA-transferase